MSDMQGPSDIDGGEAGAPEAKEETDMAIRREV